MGIARTAQGMAQDHDAILGLRVELPVHMRHHKVLIQQQVNLQRVAAALELPIRLSWRLHARLTERIHCPVQLAIDAGAAALHETSTPRIPLSEALRLSFVQLRWSDVAEACGGSTSLAQVVAERLQLHVLQDAADAHAGAKQAVLPDAPERVRRLLLPHSQRAAVTARAAGAAAESSAGQPHVCADARLVMFLADAGVADRASGATGEMDLFAAALVDPASAIQTALCETSLQPVARRLVGTLLPGVRRMSPAGPKDARDMWSAWVHSDSAAVARPQELVVNMELSRQDALLVFDRARGGDDSQLGAAASTMEITKALRDAAADAGMSSRSYFMVDAVV
jgi:hypothetical protein